MVTNVQPTWICIINHFDEETYHKECDPREALYAELS